MRKLLLILFLLPALAPSLVLADVPMVAWQYRADMLQSAWREFGPTAPVAVLAAQIHQESAWDCNAVSWAGAEGCAQFMPGTAKDMEARYPSQCAPANPFDSRWAFRCRDLYLHSLIRAVRTEGTTECSEWALGFKAYNGGLTWVRRDSLKAASEGHDPNDWKVVNQHNSGRRESAYLENKEYPERIFRHSQKYNVWGRNILC